MAIAPQPPIPSSAGRSKAPDMSLQAITALSKLYSSNATQVEQLRTALVALQKTLASTTDATKTSFEATKRKLGIKSFKFDREGTQYSAKGGAVSAVDKAHEEALKQNAEESDRFTSATVALRYAMSMARAETVKGWETSKVALTEQKNSSNSTVAEKRSATRAIASLDRDLLRDKLQMEFAGGNAAEKALSATRMSGLKFADVIEGNVGKALGFSVKGALGFGAGMATVAGAWMVATEVIGGVAQDSKKVASAFLAAGNAGSIGMGNLAFTAGRLRVAAGMAAYDFDEMMNQMGTAVNQGALSSAGFATTLNESSGAIQAEADMRLDSVATQTMATAKIGALYGMSADDSVKTAFMMKKMLGGSLDDVSNNFTAMGAQASAFRMPAQQYLSVMGMVGDKMKYLNAGFRETNTGVVNLFKAFETTREAMGNVGFWAEKSGAQIGELVTSAIEAFSNISTEDFLAYSGMQTGGDFGEQFYEAMGKTPFEKAEAAFTKLKPIAQEAGVGTDKSMVGYLYNLMPSVQALGPALGRDILDMMVKNPRLFKEMGTKSNQEQLDYFKSKGTEVDETASAIYVAGDVNKAILNSLNNFFHAFQAFAMSAVLHPWDFLKHATGIEDSGRTAQEIMEQKARDSIHRNRIGRGGE